MKGEEDLLTQYSITFLESWIVNNRLICEIRHDSYMNGLGKYSLQGKKGHKQEWGQKHMRNWKQRNNLHLYSLKI